MIFTRRVLADVALERARQTARYGLNTDTEDGTGPETRWLLPYTSGSAVEIETALRDDYEDFEAEAGAPTWVHLVREELAEAFAETDQDRLRTELVQVAALCVSWAENIDRRKLRQVLPRQPTRG